MANVNRNFNYQKVCIVLHTCSQKIYIKSAHVHKYLLIMLNTKNVCIYYIYNIIYIFIAIILLLDCIHNLYECLHRFVQSGKLLGLANRSLPPTDHSNMHHVEQSNRTCIHKLINVIYVLIIIGHILLVVTSILSTFRHFPPLIQTCKCILCSIYVQSTPSIFLTICIYVHYRMISMHCVVVLYKDVFLKHSITYHYALLILYIHSYLCLHHHVE